MGWPAAFTVVGVVWAIAFIIYMRLRLESKTDTETDK